VLRVDEGRQPAHLLGLGDDVQRERRLAARLGAVDLDDAPAGDAAHAEGHVEAQRPRGDHGHVDDLLAAEAHDGALAELALDLGDGKLYRFLPVLLV